MNAPVVSVVIGRIYKPRVVARNCKPRVKPEEEGLLTVSVRPNAEGGFLSFVRV